jgi:SAM-dependent methyltransferase
MIPTSTFVCADADGYEAQMGRWSRRLASSFIDFVGIDAADRVLDVGCGTGSLASTLARNPRIGAVHGIDLCEAYIGHARRNAREGRADFRVGDACALPFADASLDHCLSLLVLQFVPDAARALREMRRVTRSGGIVAAATWDTRGGMVIHRLFFDTAAVLDPDAAERRAKACARPMSRSDGLENAWRDAGLLEVVLESTTIRMDYAGWDDFWTSLDGRDGPYAEYLATLDARAKSTLRRLVAAAYLDGDADGPRSYAATAWLVKGRVP